MIAEDLVEVMFASPEVFRQEVEKKVSRNRKLSSKSRRDLMQFAYATLKWRDRLWSQKPESFDREKINTLAESFQNENLEQVRTALGPNPKVEQIAKYVSFPRWVIDRWIHDFGVETAIEIAWTQNQSSNPSARANTLVAPREKVIATFKDEGIAVSPGHVSESFYILEKKNLRGLVAFKKGMFEFQDEHSQQICVWINPSPKDLIIDGCSRTGGKAFHLAALTHNQAQILCLDVDARVFEELERRRGRLRVQNLKTRWIAKDDSNPCPDLVNKADIVLVDAPCTGSGTVRHNPTLRWTLTASKIQEMQSLQQSILDRQSRWVKTNGRLIYVTCSLFKEENEKVVDAFISKNPNFKVEQTHRLFPKKDGGDGFFFCSMRRTI